MTPALQYNDELPCHLEGDATLILWTQRLFRERELNGSTLAEMYEQESSVSLDRAPAPEHAVGQINFLIDAGWVAFPDQPHHGFGPNYLFRARYNCDAALLFLADKWKPCPACGTRNAHVEAKYEIVYLKCQDCNLRGTLKGWEIQPPFDQRRQSKRNYKPSKPKPTSFEASKPQPVATQTKPVAMPIKFAPRPDFARKPQTSLFDMHLEGER
jgi:hypothetical protein